MSFPIASTSAITPSIHPVESIQIPGEAGKPGEFQTALQSAIGGVETLGAAARQSIEGLLSGERQELHSVILSAQRAEIAFDLGLQIRNKIVQAYQEIMRMPM